MKQLFISILLLASQTVFAQNSSASKWNIEKPTGPAKSVSFVTDEGTWMDVDVSPDGKEIVFDLLGDIYKMPVSGGTATLLAGGSAFEVQPRFSPNGKMISYTSDKNGVNNIWIMNTDGTGKRPVTRENYHFLNNATWTPDNNFLIARKNTGNGQNQDSGELWMYHIAGGGGAQLVKSKNQQKDINEPNVSPNGKYLYYSEDLSPFQFNKDPNGEIYVIKRLDRETGEIQIVAGGTGGACRPQVSPDGRMLAYIKRVRLKTMLFLQDLNTGEEWPVYDELSRDQQETLALFGVYSNFAWTPDSRNLIFYANGKIRKLDIDSQITEIIPFEVTSQHIISEALHFQHPVFQDEFDVKMIRQLATSPNGKTIAFNAAGYIYTKDLPDGKPERVTKGTDFEFEPAFSPDGKYLVYVSWNDEDKASVNKVELKNGRITRLTTERGFYYSPRFSNKGNKIVYAKGVGNLVLGYTYSKNTGIYIITEKGETPVKIADSGEKPQFNATDTRIYFQTQNGDKKAFKSMDVNGGDIRTLYTSKTATQFVPSPDGKWIAFTENANAYVTPITETGNAFDLSSDNKILPLFKISQDAGFNLHWGADSKQLHWTIGSRYFSKDIENALAFNNPTEKSGSDTGGIKIGLTLKSDIPSGKIALTGARIITMKGDEVIKNGTILINQNKIAAIGPSAQIDIPKDAQVIHVDGETIMPGIVDVHAHIPATKSEISPQQDWRYFANLAYGITTLNDAYNNSETAFSQAEMIRSGQMTGPRIYATASLPYHTDSAFNTVSNGLNDVKSMLGRFRSIGALSVKPGRGLSRNLRQQIVNAARELHMEVMPDGNSIFFTDMSMIVDGNSGIERNLPVLPVYRDVTQLWNRSKTAYTPALIVSYGTQFGENFWYDRTNVWENEKLLNFTPRSVIDKRSRRRTTSEFGDYGHIDISKAVKQIADGGTKVNLGSNGQLQGLGSHWELWMLAQGGMSSLQAIRCATINGAEYLGMEKEIGSLEVGKLADLIVLDANPLEDIRNSEKIKYVMVNGRIFDAETMNEIGDTMKLRQKFWWQLGHGESFTVPGR